MSTAENSATEAAVRAAASPTANHAATSATLSGAKHVDSLLSGTRWTADAGGKTVLTYSFATPTSVYASGYAEASSRGVITEAQKAAARAALQEWSEVANISFTEVQDSATVAGDIRFGVSDMAAPTAYTYYPSSHHMGGDIWLSRASALTTPVQGQWGYFALVQEIGHALGLKAPHDTTAGMLGPAADAASDTTLHSVMSYRSYQSAPLSGYTQKLYSTGPMSNDIAAIQHLYGANHAHNAGDTVYSWTPGRQIFECLWDGGGIDTIDWSNQSSAAVINLKEGSFSQLGAGYYASSSQYEARNFAIAHGAVIENAIGGSADDTISGNGVANRLSGNGGNDLLTGGGGNDSIDGGIGSDSAVFTGTSAQYTITRSGSSIVVADTANGRDGTDTLTNVETLRFADGDYSVASFSEAPTVSQIPTVSQTATVDQTLTVDQAPTLNRAPTGITVSGGSVDQIDAAEFANKANWFVMGTNWAWNGTNNRAETSGAPVGQAAGFNGLGSTMSPGALAGTTVKIDAHVTVTSGSFRVQVASNGTGGADAFGNTITSTGLSTVQYTIPADATYFVVYVQSQTGGSKGYVTNFDVFSGGGTGASVAENSTAGTLVATLAATDPDSGSSFTYSLTDGRTDLFQVVGNQLQVKPGAVLDYETATSHTVTVRVTDNGGLTRDQAVTVAVTDVYEAPTANRAPTGITMTGGSVAENSAAGTVVATLAATDPDSGSSFTYSLAGGRTDLFQVVGNQLQVKPGATLDHEAAASHAVTVRVTDNAGLTRDQAVTVGVTNVNEAPTAIAVTGGSVAENAAAGTVVATLAAADPDSGGSFTYSLTAGRTDLFQVIGNQIQVKPGATLDYEAAASHGLTLRVTDNAGLTRDQAVTIGVTNVNEATINQAPTVNRAPTGITVNGGSVDQIDAAEFANQANWFVMGTNWAWNSTNNRAETSGAPVGQAAGFNGLGSTMSPGALAGTTVKIDAYVTVTSGSFRVQVSSNGTGGADAFGNTIASTGLSTVQYTIPADATYFVVYVQSQTGGSTGYVTNFDVFGSGGTGANVAENSTAGTLVATLAATDPDSGSSFTYSLTDGRTDLFQVVGNQLQVKPGATLDYETATSHTVTVRVTDNGGLTRDQAVTVAVTDVNEAPTGSTVTGTNGRDTLNGTTGSDVLNGLAGNDTLNGGNGNDLLNGGTGNDALYGGADSDTLSGMDGADRLFGQDGDDTLAGGSGRDELTGGNGRDRFKFDAPEDSGAGAANRDRIFDFTSGQDVLDLSTIDAKTGGSTNDTFVLTAAVNGQSGLGAFTRVQGQLRWQMYDNSGTANDFTLVQGDRDGDGAADFEIQLIGLVRLTPNDFSL